MKIYYEGEILGEKVVFQEDAYTSMLLRFNEENRQWNKIDNLYEIHIPCGLCDLYEHCEGCPLNVFRLGDKLGCNQVFESLLGSDYIKTIRIGEDTIVWYKEDDINARLMLDVIYAKLKLMKKIEIPDIKEVKVIAVQSSDFRNALYIYIYDDYYSLNINDFATTKKMSININKGTLKEIFYKLMHEERL